MLDLAATAFPASASVSCLSPARLRLTGRNLPGCRLCVGFGSTLLYSRSRALRVAQMSQRNGEPDKLAVQALEARLWRTI